MSSASNNMDKKLLLIQHLYGEREDAEELKELLKDPACRAEYEVLRDVKRKLENRALRRPVTAPEDAVDQDCCVGPSQTDSYLETPHQSLKTICGAWWCRGSSGLPAGCLPTSWAADAGAGCDFGRGPEPGGVGELG